MKQATSFHFINLILDLVSNDWEKAMGTSRRDARPDSMELHGGLDWLRVRHAFTWSG